MNLEIECDGKAEFFEEPENYLATMHINGVPHHLMLFPVQDEEGYQQAADVRCDDWLEGMEKIDGDSEPFLTIEIDGKPHVAVLTPFKR